MNNLPLSPEQKKLKNVGDLMKLYMDAEYKGDRGEMENLKIYIIKNGGTVD